MSDIERRTDPIPAAMIDRLDYSRVTQLLGDVLTEHSDLAELLTAGRLTWLLEGWDEHGAGTVSVLYRDTGAVFATACLHWSALV